MFYYLSPPSVLPGWKRKYYNFNSISALDEISFKTANCKMYHAEFISKFELCSRSLFMQSRNIYSLYLIALSQKLNELVSFRSIRLGQVRRSSLFDTELKTRWEFRISWILRDEMWMRIQHFWKMPINESGDLCPFELESIWVRHMADDGIGAAHSTISILEYLTHHCCYWQS